MTTTPDPVQSFAGLGKLDIGKLDVGKLDDLVSTVWDHKDEVADAVAFVRDHGDELIALAAKLPDLLASASAALTEAAADTRATATFLTGGDQVEHGVKALAQLAGEALETCRRELDDARGAMGKLASALGDVPLIGAAAARLEDGAAHFDGVGVQLAAVAEHLRGIGDLVDRAGEGLARTADKLDGGGRALRSFGS